MRRKPRACAAPEPPPAARCRPLPQGKRYRYRGSHQLEPLVRFLSRALVSGTSSAWGPPGRWSRSVSRPGLLLAPPAALGRPAWHRGMRPLAAAPVSPAAGCWTHHARGRASSLCRSAGPRPARAAVRCRALRRRSGRVRRLALRAHGRGGHRGGADATAFAAAAPQCAVPGEAPPPWLPARADVCTLEIKRGLQHQGPSGPTPQQARPTERARAPVPPHPSQAVRACVWCWRRRRRQEQPPVPGAAGAAAPPIAAAAGQAAADGVPREALAAG